MKIACSSTGSNGLYFEVLKDLPDLREVIDAQDEITPDLGQDLSHLLIHDQIHQVMLINRGLPVGRIEVEEGLDFTFKMW